MTDDEVVALYEATVDDVFRYATRLTGGDRAWAEEVVQDTYLGLVRRLRAGEGLAVDAGWLMVACRHRFFDDSKRQRRRRERERLASVARPTEAPFAGIVGLFESLTSEYREVLVLRYVDDLTVAEIADCVGRSSSATASLLHRAKQALRASMVEDDQ